MCLCAEAPESPQFPPGESLCWGSAKAAGPGKGPGSWLFWKAPLRQPCVRNTVKTAAEKAKTLASTSAPKKQPQQYV
ncbi:hypothetical protein DPEC_G00183880 [Dallia pectoralis]|uniref:Uncharacterized protein n=1 Tax=Dallia pectoralis TaxID=75939 RepID=A0ACC2GB76_DALPE|nr:hypothetical protein DPEC_G00183880 [Dallia pectoralis]